MTQTPQMARFTQLLPRDVLNLLAVVVSPITLYVCMEIDEMKPLYDYTIINKYNGDWKKFNYIVAKGAIDNNLTDIAISIYSSSEIKYQMRIIDHIRQQYFDDKTADHLYDAHDNDHDPTNHTLPDKLCVNIIRKHMVEIRVHKSGIYSEDVTTDVIVPKDHPALVLMLEDDPIDQSIRICPCRWLCGGNKNGMGNRIKCDDCDYAYADFSEITDIPSVYYEFIFCYNGVFVNKIVDKYELTVRDEVHEVVKQLIRDQHTFHK